MSFFPWRLAWLTPGGNCKIVPPTTLIALKGLKAHQKYFQTSFILGEQAGRVDISSVGWAGGGGGPRGGQRSSRESTLPLPATMLCCGGKKVRERLQLQIRSNQGFHLLSHTTWLCYATAIAIQPTVLFHLYLCFDGKIREFCIFRDHLILSSHLSRDKVNTEVSW